MRKGMKPNTVAAGILALLLCLMSLCGCRQEHSKLQRQLSAADSLYSQGLYHMGMHHCDSARLRFYKLNKARFALDASKVFMEVYQAKRQTDSIIAHEKEKALMRVYQAKRQMDSVIAHENEMACNLVITDHQTSTHHAEKGNAVNQTFNRRTVAVWLFGLLALIVLIIFVVIFFFFIFKIRQFFFRSIHSAQSLTTNFYPCKPEQEKPEESESGCNYIQDSGERLANTPIVEKLRQIRRQDKCTLSDIDWEELHNAFSKYKPRLYNECLCAAHLTKQEFIVCMLICLQFQTSDISILLHTSDQRISNIKKTANRKLFQEATGRSLYKNLCEADSSEGAQ